ncbi:MAG: excinuclease ABC subunit UvrC [Pontimonas sp.]
MAGPAWRPRSADIPTQPGVYRFIDSRARVIYVGKAKNLRNRLTTYFGPPDGLLERTRRMVQTARSVDWTVVQTERAALQLEYAWIKEFQPDFNVRFRDDKSYPYLVVTVGDEIPRVFLSRRKDIPGAKYFGPFANSWALKDTLSTLLRAFPVRSCTQGVYQRAKKANRSCLLGDIGKCAAPCVGRIEPADHKALALGLASFMDGKDDGVLDSVRYDMLQAAERLDFERAAKLRDRIEAIETILVKNTMVLDDTIDADVFGLAHDELHAAAHVFRIRGGRIRQARGWVVDVDKKPSRAELVELILRDGFDEHFPPAKLIIVPELPREPEMWAERLTHQRREAGERGGAEIRVAKRGDLATLADTVRLNAAQTLQGYLSKRQNDVVSRSAALAELADYLGLEEAPLRIECFDVSHLGGENQVASMVVFEDGIPRREHYRKFAIDGARDDTEAIYQVLSRRLKRLAEPESMEGEEKTKNSFAYPPGLFVIDGGLPQVNAAQRALDEAGISIGVCGLAKRLEEVWRPADQFPLVLPRSSEALFLLQRVRDEAHRVAISYQRTTRKKSLRSQLLDVPGVGEAMTKRLLTSFGSVAAVKSATIEELRRVPGVGSELAERIHQALR